MSRSPDVEKTSILKPHGTTGRPSRHPICHSLWSFSSSSTQSSPSLRLTTCCPNDPRHEGLYTTPHWQGAAVLSAAGSLSSESRKMSRMQISTVRKTTTRSKRATTSRIFHQIPRNIISGSWSYVLRGTSRRCMTQTSTTTIKCHLASCHLLILNSSMSALYGGGSRRRIAPRAFWNLSNNCTNATRCLWTAYQKHLGV